ncbi:TetR/AcrR family transcriptional regulator [Georgenia yuyongxinii]|uniref:TetR/AcrR family transcriptional regulator n=1 Tax=Georgenia yuyongxinii TaxID=2589797 RepID=A0A552WW74_9MICO|nr:TetR/AcrR family transcriptional regulator [Georgenia yuyongxinii]TRW47032.1 TetR/AcrR family transcriptional regulator [Georgenia yuyongxinii]
MSLRSAQKRMTRTRLQESGLKIFQEKGYVAATVDDIAAGAGANRATFYLHFSSKAQLMRALIEEINETIVASDVPRLTTVIAEGGRDQIRAFHNRRFEQWPAIMPTITAANQAADVDAEVQAAVTSWHETPIAEIAAGLELSGRFEPASRHARAVAAFAQLEYFSRRWAHEGWGNGLEREASLDVLTEAWYCLLVGA